MASSHKIKETFSSVYEESKRFNGCNFSIINFEWMPKEEGDGENPDIMFGIMLSVNGENIEYPAWPEEIFEDWMK